MQFNTSQMRSNAAAQLQAGEKYPANVKHLIKSSLLYRLTFVRNIIQNLTHAQNVTDQPNTYNQHFKTPLTDHRNA
jgi:hypothetical protein